MGISELHANEYADKPKIIISVPGSVPLIGEHSEDFGGNVIAAGISLRLWLAISFRHDSQIRFWFSNLDERKRISSASLGYRREDKWANRIKSVLERLSNDGCSIRGMNISIFSQIPSGVGLGSSAALLLASAAVFSKLYSREINGLQLVDFCRTIPEYGEQKFSLYEIIVPVISKPGNFTKYNPLIDRASTIPVTIGENLIIITDSNVPRTSIDDEYKSRIEDVKKCIHALGMRKGNRSLAGISTSDLGSLMGQLPESTRRKCIFLVDEINRGMEAEETIRKYDIMAFGKILGKSGLGLRDLYEVTLPEIDWLIKRSLELDGVIFSRMSGKGFGGCIISVMSESAFDQYLKKLEEYERIFGFRASTYNVNLDGGILIEEFK